MSQNASLQIRHMELLSQFKISQEKILLIPIGTKINWFIYVNFYLMC